MKSMTVWLIAAMLAVCLLAPGGSASAETVESLAAKNASLEAAVRELITEVRTLKDEVQILKRQVRVVGGAAASGSAAGGSVAGRNDAAPASAGTAGATTRSAATEREMAALRRDLGVPSGETVRQSIGLPEEANAVASGGNTAELSLSGQVNRMMLWADDGTKSGTFFTDNGNSSTRIRIIGSANLNEDWSAGTIIEAGIRSNQSGAIDLDDPDSSTITDGGFNLRKAELYFDNVHYGRVWAGRGSTATDNSSEVDLSGTAVAAYASVGDIAGGLAFRTPGADVADGPTIGGSFNDLDGFGRQDRIQYDSPSFAGFRLKASAQQGGAVAAGAFYTGQFEGEDLGSLNGTKVAAAFGLGDQSASSDEFGVRINGSGSVLFPFGTNLTVAGGMDQATASGRDDRSFVYAKLGQQVGIWDLGKTSFSLDYYNGSAINANASTSQSVGGFVVQDFDSIGAQIYGGVRVYSYDAPGTDYDDIFTVSTGARVKF